MLTFFPNQQNPRSPNPPDSYLYEPQQRCHDETIKRHSYNDNIRHKERELKKVKFTSMRENVREHLLTKFNFKKTTAWKSMWTCDGYGGMCSGCKHRYSIPKKYHKEYFTNTNNNTCTYISKAY